MWEDKYRTAVDELTYKNTKTHTEKQHTQTLYLLIRRLKIYDVYLFLHEQLSN